MIDLKGKKVLVTGASGGIGKAIAIELSSNGADLCLTGRNKSELESLQKLIGGNCEIIISDLSKSEGIDELANSAQEKMGQIDILVNNAGIAVGSAIEDVSMEDALYQFEVNLFGIGRTVKATLPHMRAQGSGTIINISSVLGKVYNPLYGWYVSSKHALEGWLSLIHI